jgi:hypothetical protein
MIKDLLTIYPELVTKKRKMDQHQDERKLERKTCPGTHQTPNQFEEISVSKCARSFKDSVKTFLE